MVKSNWFMAATLSTVLTVLGSLATSSQAQAQTFQGTSTGTFGTPNPGGNGNPQFSGVGTNTFSFGEALAGSSPNQLTFNGNSFSTGFETPFEFGTFTYFNGITELGTTINSVPLNLQLAFTTPSGITENVNYDLQFNITPNSTGDPNLDADFLFPVNNFGTGSFNVGGTEYTLEVLGFSTDGGATIASQFRLPEEQSVTSGAVGRITVAPPSQDIPEPDASITSLGLSVLGVGLLLKRKQKNQQSAS